VASYSVSHLIIYGTYKNLYPIYHLVKDFKKYLKSTQASKDLLNNGFNVTGGKVVDYGTVGSTLRKLIEKISYDFLLYFGSGSGMFAESTGSEDPDLGRKTWKETKTGNGLA
jgi:hypothetical protein